MKEILYLVIPCYNEQEVLLETARRLLKKITIMIENEAISQESRILFVNDGSKDKTWSIIEELYFQNKIFSGINLSRNRGHQNALLAGLMTAKEYADIVISLDADLQDDINVIDEFVDQYYKGSDVVYGVRSSRKTDTFFKRTTALAFYKLMSGLGVDSVYNHADYRLMSKRALQGLSQFKEVNLFLRGMVPLVGYKYSIVEYERHERFAGESKYPLKKMIAFALDGITSLSIKPIRIITGLGFTIFFLSIVALIYSLVVNFIGNTITGWTSLTISIWMLGGIQLLSLGIIGEYIGKIYNETKQRPRFIISDKLISNDVNNE
ncbi:glycosyltransferase family 2 protein [Clostridium beijerinckii]|uniref:Glycosyltransferase involved in cell wall biosynthesis n=1 Tax=Clostridium beijerinckii TaxID=1520 RepID=A0AAE5H0V2_CLOBE|nr:glycosyltransferase family 2 protein [Clostridium beijerinckii]NSB12446.1 glycosyltransferase involved in cell wall biosynthesis [Clostridium beijerinckii]OOM19274.1 putative glycosyltransferase YkoT [Clostridium beijerinckii]